MHRGYAVQLPDSLSRRIGERATVLYGRFWQGPQHAKERLGGLRNQLSYVDPAPNCSSFGCRVQFPPGYAPLHTGPIDAFLRRLTWDDINRRPSLSRALSGDQERRVQQLFVAAPGYVEPFPESNIKRAFDISEEPPPS